MGLYTEISTERPLADPPFPRTRTQDWVTLNPLHRGLTDGRMSAISWDHLNQLERRHCSAKQESTALFSQLRASTNLSPTESGSRSPSVTAEILTLHD